MNTNKDVYLRLSAFHVLDCQTYFKDKSCSWVEYFQWILSLLVKNFPFGKKPFQAHIRYVWQKSIVMFLNTKSFSLQQMKVIVIYFLHWLFLMTLNCLYTFISNASRWNNLDIKNLPHYKNFEIVNMIFIFIEIIIANMRCQEMPYFIFEKAFLWFQFIWS